MTVPNRAEQTCETCGRTVFKRGVMMVVEAGVTPDGEAPVVQDLDKMRTSARRDVRDRHADIQERFRQIAAYGKVEVPHQMNWLRGDLWEIKTAEDRVPFYRRSSAGHMLAARVLFVFAKARGKTADGKIPRKFLDRGMWILEGDRSREQIA